MTAATIPLALAAAIPENHEWTPSSREQLVFRWVKFEGKTQAWVAEQLGIHQSTVSRTVERYEKWIAHGGPGRQGALTHEERVRAQRWLTYERNEWILSAALRIAAEMEQPCEATKSTLSRSAASPSQETEIRTQHMTFDRSGVANRFLRLAHRVNMENLTLVEEEPLPPLEPLLFKDVWEPEEEHGPRVIEQPEAIPADEAAAEFMGPVADEPLVSEPVGVEPARASEERPAMQAMHNPDYQQSLLNLNESLTCSKKRDTKIPRSVAYSVVN